MKVFIANPHKQLVRSTDHNYVHKSFVRMGEHTDIEFCINRSPLSSLFVNLNYLKNRISSYFMSRPEQLIASPYSNIFLVNAPEQCDVIFSYGGYPMQIHKKKKPIVCEQSYAFGGVIDQSVWKEYLIKNRRFFVERADVLVTPSLESMNKFIEVFPQYSNKIRVIPYYLPYLQAINDAQLKKKYSSFEKIRVLFVGKEAKRKGLDVFISAYLKLSKEIQARFEVTVVSRFLDGKISMPDAFFHKTYVKDLQEEFHKAHLLLFLTKREAYGLVLVEAMAAGCAVLTTDHPIQRSIMNQNGGWFVNPNDVDAVYQKLLEIAATPVDAFFRLGQNNIENFVLDKSPAKVCSQYYNLFKELS